MARSLTAAQMILDAQRLADLENASGRFSSAEWLDYINRGIAYVYRKMITVSDHPFFQKTMPNITMQAGVTVYPLAADFLSILSVLWSTSQGGPFDQLDPFSESERVDLVNSGYYGGMYPRAYRIYGDGGTGAFTQGTIPTAYSIEILPSPVAGGVVQVRYVPTPPLLQQTADVFDGILGFEDAACTWAAILARRKDDLPTDDLERDFMRNMAEVTMIARRRDRSRPPKVSIVRGRGYNRGRGGGGNWGGRGGF